MKLIYVKGYSTDEKMTITREYLLPELIDEYNLYYRKEGTPEPKKSILELTDKNINFIINFGSKNGTHFESNEEGVRQIKQRLEKLCSLINIVKITDGKWTKPVHSILDTIPEFEKFSSANYPIKLSNKTLEKLLKIKNLESNTPPFGMYS